MGSITRYTTACYPVKTIEHSNTITPCSPTVLLVTEAATTGIGRHILDLAQGLLRRQVRTHLVYSDRRSDRGFRDRMPQIQGLKHHRVSMRRAPHPTDALAWCQLIQYIRRQGPFDIVHGHGSKAGAIVRLLPSTVAPIRVYTPHALITMDPQLGGARRWFYLNIERLIAQRGAQMIAVGHHERQHAQERNIASDRVCVIQNGVTQEPLRPRRIGRTQINAAPNDVVVGFVGRLAPQKDPEALVHALSLARQRAPQLRLVMVGEGPLRAKIEALCDRLSLRARVDMLGWQPASDWLAAMDLLAMPSRYEAMPYILIEALNARLPVITTRVGESESLIEHGSNGLTVPTDNIAALANAMVELALNPDRRDQMANAAASSVSHLTLGRMVDQTLDLYTRLSATTLKLPERQKPVQRHQQREAPSAG